MITHLTVPGITTVHAIRAVYTALAAVEGITRAEVRLGGASVEHDGRATADALRAAVAVAGVEVGDVVEERRTLPLL